jgi:hypothetical protein
MLIKIEAIYAGKYSVAIGGRRQSTSDENGEKLLGA